MREKEREIEREREPSLREIVGGNEIRYHEGRCSPFVRTLQRSMLMSILCQNIYVHMYAAV